MKKFLIGMLLIAGSVCLAAIEVPVAAKRSPVNTGLLNAKNGGTFSGREMLRREGRAGKKNPDNPPPFDFASAEETRKTAESLLKEGSITDPEIARELRSASGDLERLIQTYGSGGVVTTSQNMELLSAKYKIENLLGAALNAKKPLKVLKFGPMSERSGRLVPATAEYGFADKVNTGWILDQKVYDPTVEKMYPTIPVDIRSNEEGASDTEVDDDGLVWHVQSFYFSDPLPDGEGTPTHPVPSYSLAIYVSLDGGPTWYLWGVLYDPAGGDVINPRLAIDILPADNRLFIAYEYVVSAGNHDIYVYSETIGGTPNPLDAAIATSALMEKNPDIASDYHQGQTSYRAIAFEKEASAGSYNYDIYASQSTGAGAASDWSSAIAVTADASSERNPSLSNGSSGNSTFTQYMHLAYNYDIYSTSQLLLNNGFESGADGSWTVRVSGDINCAGTYSRTGSCAAWLGGVVNYPSWPGDWIYQQVTIPAEAVDAQLSLWLKITSSESGTTPYDYFYIDVRDTSGALLGNLATFSNADEDTYATYQQLSYNLSAYKGQTVRLYLWATNDSSYTSSFFVDDTALNITVPSGYEVRYARAEHPGATPYPAGLQAAGKITVLSDYGIGWDYGPPSVIATHGGGSASWTQGRVAVAADQHFPAGNPNPEDLERHQLCFAWNMCNGGTGCGTMTCGTDTLSKDWQESWFYDGRGDERYPSLIQDGSGVSSSGLSLHPYIYMAYFHRVADSLSDTGEVQLILSDPSDETCDGFIYGYWYYFTASYKVTDPDDLVSPSARTLNAFNYWDGWPGVTFNKKISHVSGGTNDDIFCSTLGDNYTFNTYSGGTYLDLVLSLDGVTYATPHTFPWAAGYTRDILAVSPQEQSGINYVFMHWSNAQTDPTLTVTSDFCDPVNPCPEVNFIAMYLGSPIIATIVDIDPCAQNGIQVNYAAGPGAAGHDLYKDGSLAVAGYISGAAYDPGDTDAHTYFVRAVNGSVYSDSAPMDMNDATCGAGVPPEVSDGSSESSAQLWTGASQTAQIQYWQPASGATGYRLYRGIQSNLAGLCGSATDFCTRYDGGNLSQNCTSDDPSGVAGRCFYYLVTAYNGEGEGSPGGAGAFCNPRQINTAGVCP